MEDTRLIMNRQAYEMWSIAKSQEKEFNEILARQHQEFIYFTDQQLKRKNALAERHAREMEEETLLCQGQLGRMSHRHREELDSILQENHKILADLLSRQQEELKELQGESSEGS